MKKTLLYIFAAALASMALFGLQSCGLEEPYFGPQEDPSAGVVEFIARPASYHSHDVTTKADGNPSTFEDDEIHNAFLLVFNEAGQRLLCEEINLTTEEGGLASEYGQLSVKIDRSLGSNVTACILANVPADFARGITGLESLNTAVLDLKYDYSKSGILGVPVLDLDQDNKAVPCIPMFGQTNGTINLSNANSVIGIDLTRLFAKISLNIKMQLTNNQVGYISPTLVNYELDQYQLHNLPTKVSLIKNNAEDSAWKSIPDAFTGKSDLDPVSSPNNLGLKTININDNDNNASNNTGNVKAIEFCLYVPEYYLSPKETITDNQKWKPENYDSSNYAIYLELIGEVNQGLIDNTGIRHRIYLGGDNTKDFTLKRNVNYINQITITGITKNDKGTGEDLDHRVSTDIINNPVAQAGKAANCYIIAKPGEYTIPAYKGAYNNLTGASLCMAGKDLSEYNTRVEILANMVEYQNLTSITFSKEPVYDPETNTISFVVNKMLSDNWVPNGSVIMALQYKKKGDTEWITEWSWHLWFVFNITASADGWGTILPQDMPDGTTKMMDRNLGVNTLTNAGTEIGFYYKYGEHTPYLDPDGDGTYTKCGGGSIGDSNPAWNSTAKSVTDPCPPGYKMPSLSVWESIGSKSTIYDAYLYSGDDNALNSNVDIYFPYSSYLIETSTAGSFTKFSPSTETVSGVDKTEREYSFLGTGLAFRDVYYSLPIKKAIGLFNTADGRIIYDGVDDGILSDLSITKFQYRTKTWFGYGSWKDGNPNISIGGINLTDFLQSLKRDIEATDELQKLTKASLRKESIDYSQGYQVRCVKE